MGRTHPKKKIDLQGKCVLEFIYTSLSLHLNHVGHLYRNIKEMCNFSRCLAIPKCMSTSQSKAQMIQIHY